MSVPRIVCQFSCGAASAVATKLTLSQFGATNDVQIINAINTACDYMEIRYEVPMERQP